MGKWLAHLETGRKPWKVSKQIRSLSPEGRERDAELNIYRKFSMIKHGNPAARGLGFSVHAEGPTLALYGDDMSPGMSVACLSYAGTNLLDATAAADYLLPSVGHDLGDVLEAARGHYSALARVHTDPPPDQRTEEAALQSSGDWPRCLTRS